MRLSRSPQHPLTGPEESQVQKSSEIQQILVPRHLPQLIVRLKWERTHLILSLYPLRSNLLQLEPVTPSWHRYHQIMMTTPTHSQSATTHRTLLCREKSRLKTSILILAKEWYLSLDLHQWKNRELFCQDWLPHLPHLPATFLWRPRHHLLTSTSHHMIRILGRVLWLLLL